MNIFQKISIWLIKLYQRTLSLDHGPMKKIGIKVCIYHPTCSEYTAQAIEKYGVFKGSFLGLWRIMRCNLWAKGGDDPVK